MQSTQLGKVDHQIGRELANAVFTQEKHGQSFHAAKWLVIVIDICWEIQQTMIQVQYMSVGEADRELVRELCDGILAKIKHDKFDQRRKETRGDFGETWITHLQVLKIKKWNKNELW